MIFISHISEESIIALVLKEWVESTLLGQYPVFVSSDRTALPPGVKWLDEISKALSQTQLLLLICSRQSINRPWINFEAGCAWIKDIPIIPICHSGLQIEDLPPPISSFQALDMMQSSFPYELFGAISHHFAIKRLPNLPYSQMAVELQEATRQVKPNHKASDEASEPASVQRQEAFVNKQDEELLVFMNQSGGTVTAILITKELGKNIDTIEAQIEKLRSRGFVGKSGAESALYNRYHLLDKGRDYLQEKNLK